MIGHRLYCTSVTYVAILWTKEVAAKFTLCKYSQLIYNSNKLEPLFWRDKCNLIKPQKQKFKHDGM